MSRVLLKKFVCECGAPTLLTFKLSEYELFHAQTSTITYVQMLPKSLPPTLISFNLALALTLKPIPQPPPHYLLAQEMWSSPH